MLIDKQEDVVRGVLDGSWDVGFVRTGVVEQTTDLETGELVDPEQFKVVAPRIYIMDDGDLFPYLHSTPVAVEGALDLTRREHTLSDRDVGYRPIEDAVKPGSA